MNYLIIAVSIIAIIPVAIYLKKSFDKISVHQMPFSKAFNPSYTVEQYKNDLLRDSLMPIISEIENKNLSKFITTWRNKFENNTLSVEDVKFLNSQIDSGNANQLAGILSLHPNATEMYSRLNDTLKEKEQPVLEEEVA